MRILLVAATAMEIAPVEAQLQVTAVEGPLKTGRYSSHTIDVLVTGIGMVATAAWCSRVLAERRYDLALNSGVCGSFDPALEPGQVVHVTSDCIAELGAEDGEAFLSLQDMKLATGDEFPFTRGELVNAAPPDIQTLNGLRRVVGITVNTVHGRDASITEVVARLRPEVESMEGAAFMYACLVGHVPFAQVRAVSNVVERRNRAAWKLGDAVEALGATVVRILGDA